MYFACHDHVGSFATHLRCMGCLLYIHSTQIRVKTTRIIMYAIFASASTRWLVDLGMPVCETTSYRCMGTVIDPPSDLCRQLSLFGTSFYMLFPDLNARYFGVSIWAQNARFLVDVYIKTT